MPIISGNVTRVCVKCCRDVHTHNYHDGNHSFAGREEGVVEGTMGEG